MKRRETQSGREKKTSNDEKRIVKSKRKAQEKSEKRRIRCFEQTAQIA